MSDPRFVVTGLVTVLPEDRETHELSELFPGPTRPRREQGMHIATFRLDGQHVVGCLYYQKTRPF